MATLEIRKQTDKVWLHIPSDNDQYIVSKLYIKSEGDNVRVVELGGSQRGIYNYADVSVYDIGGTAETFTSASELMQRLEALGYVGFFYDGEVSPILLISSDVGNAITLGSDGKLYVTVSGGGGAWGSITGTLSDQIDLQSALNEKLSNDITDYTTATTPLEGTELALIEQGGTFKKVAVSEFGGVTSVTGDSVDNTDPLNPIINAIPLSGTTLGNPVTGDIEILELVKIKNGNRFIRFTDELSVEIGSINEMEFGYSGYVNGEISNYVGTDSQIASLQTNIVTTIYSSTNPIARGFSGLQDFTPNITDLDYTQKIYVDTKVPKVTTSGVERVYTINTDGSQGTKPISELLVPFDIIKNYPNQIVISATGNSFTNIGTYAQTVTGTQSDILIGGVGVAFRKILSAASAGSNANFYDAGAYRINGTKGFYYRARIKNDDPTNIPTARFSYGFSGTAIMGNINPSTYSQALLCFGADNSDTNCQIMYKLSGGSTTKINLGATMPKSQSDDYVIEFWRLEGTTTINYKITNLTTSVIVSGSFTFAFSGLALGCFRNNDIATTAVSFAIRRVELYIND